MLVKQMEQVERLSGIDLQFFAEEPGGQPGTPPVVSGGNSEPSAGSQPTGQAATPSAGGQSQPASQGQTPEQQLQAAIKGMNEAQQDRASWVNVAKEYGFNSADEAKAAFQFYKAANDDPQALLKGYFGQNPDALATILNENKMQAAALFGQVFNGGQPTQQQDPFDGVTTYQELANILMKQVEGVIDKKISPAIQPIQQTLQSQKEAEIKARENTRIPKECQEAVWNKVKEVGLPFNLIETQPWLIDGLIVQAMGGREKYEESIKTSATAAAAQNVTGKIVQNNSVAPLTPGGGVAVSTAKQPITNPNERLKAAMQMIETMKAAKNAGS
jgi:hypothetical protein